MTETAIPTDLRAGRTGRRIALAIPTPEEIEAAADVIQRARDARTLARRRARNEARRAGLPVMRYQQAAFLCSWCGLGFEARVLNRSVIGRYCSAGCRQLAYSNRKRLAARRAAKVATDA